MRIYCDKCSQFVDVVARKADSVTASCTHDIRVRTVPFDQARPGLELCLRSAEQLVTSSRTLLRQGDNRTAFFLVLSAYEEMAKCRRILDAAAENAVTHSPLLLEEALFRYHPTKYRLTMDYLDQWIPTNDEIRKLFSPAVASRDNADLQADRAAIKARGFEIRNSCLYVDYDGGWIDKATIDVAKVERNLRMIESMMDGYRSSLAQWNLAIS